METWQLAALVVAVCCSLAVCMSFAFGAFQWASSSRRNRGSRNQSYGSPASASAQVAAQVNEEAVCPTYYGWKNCTDAEFNNGYSTGAAQVLNDRLGYTRGRSGTIGAHNLCCKKMNAIGDERPEVQQKIRDRHRNIMIFSIIADVVTSFLPLGRIVGLARDMAFLGSDIAMASSGAEPMISCQNSWEGSDRSIVAHDFKTSEGDPTWQLFQTDNGCPIKVGMPAEVEYAEQVGRAMRDLSRADQGGGFVNWKKINIIPFDEFKPSYGKEGRDWSRIQCRANCPKDPVSGQCQCAKCTNTNEAMECMRCERIKGDDSWTCTHGGIGDRSDDIPMPFDICNGAGRGC